MERARLRLVDLLRGFSSHFEILPCTCQRGVKRLRSPQTTRRPRVQVCAGARLRSPRVCVTPPVTDARLFACGRCGSSGRRAGGQTRVRSRRVGSARFPLRRWVGAAVRRRRRRLSGCADMRAKRICIPRAYVHARVSQTALRVSNEKLLRGSREPLHPFHKKNKTNLQNRLGSG